MYKLKANVNAPIELKQTLEYKVPLTDLALKQPSCGVNSLRSDKVEQRRDN